MGWSLCLHLGLMFQFLPRMPLAESQRRANSVITAHLGGTDRHTSGMLSPPGDLFPPTPGLQGFTMQGQVYGELG